MPPANDPADRKVVVRRVFDAPAEQVFEAWLNPASVGKWLFATPTGEVVQTQIDARIGGWFRIVDRRNGEDIEHVGEYLEIDRPRRLVFTFSVPKFSSEATKVTVDLAPLDRGCELTLTHEGVLPDYLERTKAGWGMILDGLARSLEAQRSNSMSESSDRAALNGDREILITRVFNAPRDLVFQVWTDPQHVAQWWGPTGFTTTTHHMEVKPGGVWRHTMHGPDGRDYPNKIIYLEVVRPERLVYKHAGEPETEPVDFQTIVTFAEEGSQTRVTMQMQFPTGAARDEVIKKYGALEGATQHFASLAEYLAKL
jgi:uncharacterized protein YndB with AHSA1/START domain